jgi:hypothetical protein
MVRHVFFSFHFDRDHWRANQIRNSWVTQDREVAGYVDAAEWEKIKRRNDSEIEQWIDNQINGTSVTVVLIGSETYGRKWIDYEIEQSVRNGNGFVGVYVHNVKDQDGRTTSKGRNPLSKWSYEGGRGLDEIYNNYNWKNDNGRDNFGDWVEEAAKIFDRR